METFLKKRTYLALFSIIIITFISFSPALNNGFTDWDDNKYLVYNEAVHELSFESIQNLFVVLHTVKYHYHPLTFLSFMIENHFFGLNPFFYIFNNILLHCFNAGLVFLFILSLTKRLEMASIVAVLFGIHPMHVESVAWVVERKDVLYSFFYLSALIMYCRYCLKGFQFKYYGYTFLLFMLSCLSKPAAITLPAILILVDLFYGRLKKEKIRILVEKIPFMVISAICLWIAMHQYDSGRIDIYSTLDYVLFGCYSFTMYIAKCFVPAGLSAFYPFPGQVTYAHYFSPLFVIAFLYLFIRYARKSSVSFFGASFFLVIIFLAVGYPPSNNALMAERYTYLSYIGLFILIAQGYCYLIDLYPICKRFMNGIVLLIIVGFAGFTGNRCLVWKDGISLWSDVIKKYPLVEMAYNNRGNAYAKSERYEEAIKDYQDTLNMNPYNPAIYNNIGHIYSINGRQKQAIQAYSRAIDIFPKFITALLNRAKSYRAQGLYDKALADYTRVLEIDPANEEASGKKKQLTEIH